MPQLTKRLKVLEKFRAPAALYVPATTAGNRWSIISGPGTGGCAIIQVQENANDGGPNVAVVRFQVGHTMKDVMNARIMNQLPIRRVSHQEVCFKCVSTTTNNFRQRTVFKIKFEKTDDTEDFLMWWYAKNGAIEQLISSSKREAITDSTDQMEKKPKASDKDQQSENMVGPDSTDSIHSTKNDNGSSDSDVLPLRESTKRNHVSFNEPNKANKEKDLNSILSPPKKKMKYKDTKEKGLCDNSGQEETGSANYKGKEDGSVRDVSEDDTDSDGFDEDKEEVEIDFEDAPQSQNWEAAFYEWET
mmetsp:Transcript_19228/g.41791  ORF Transcript_19228/g.41791 Transcript_19228/m.41791 type:complete len:303 (+) Transcript_19228:369-1277(+)|eukprot:CAMPEP_0168167084 /NCGR_PEP_ID=MMETSP0139_2-20121125/2367_1 /TAXON_ID=44445 /ORGANISM="Pseudo-nitzschia australis, Strain 10249 10 AB" /LENGTH=302 /DNA_ID=CAMNT_0008084315 /DNA_START=305 /DNA_END=1213 /DNA_ORIENTATION=-